jgi:hypothetical protein
LQYDLVDVLSKGDSFAALRTRLSAELRVEQLYPFPHATSIEYHYDLHQATYPANYFPEKPDIHIRVQSVGALANLFDERSLPSFHSNKDSLTQLDMPADAADAWERSLSPENPLDSQRGGKNSEMRVETGSDFRPDQFANSSWTHLPPLSLASGDFDQDQEEVSGEREEEDHSQSLQFIQYQDCSVLEEDPVIVLEPRFRPPPPLKEDSCPRLSLDSSDFATLYFDSPVLTPHRLSALPSPKTSRSGFGDELDSYGIQLIPDSEICLGPAVSSLSTVLEMAEECEAGVAQHRCSSACLLL